MSVIKGSALSENTLPILDRNAKVILKGKYNGQKSSFGLSEDTLSKHIMLVGCTGSGKSNLFYHIINQIKCSMTQDDVMIIFDTKGDYYNKFFSKRDSVIGNSFQYEKQSEKWNIYKELVADGWDNRKVAMNAQEICKSLFRERTEKNHSNPFFPNAARDLLAAILTGAVLFGNRNTKFKNENFYNNRLKEFLDTSTRESLCRFLRGDASLMSVMSYIDKDTAQSQGVIAEMYSVIRDIFVGVFADKGMFSIRQFVRKKGARTLFIEYDLAIGNVLSPMYKLLFDLALKEALGRTKSQGNVYLICDEFKLLPNLQHIDDGVNFGRSLGVKVFAGIQSIEQLYEIYGKNRGRNIAAGFSTMISFRANDVTTREYISNLYGHNIVLEEIQMLNTETKEEKRIGHTVEDWDLNSLRVGEAIVGLPFSLPFKFYFNLYNG